MIDTLPVPIILSRGVVKFTFSTGIAKQDAGGKQVCENFTQRRAVVVGNMRPE